MKAGPSSSVNLLRSYFSASQSFVSCKHTMHGQDPSLGGLPVGCVDHNRGKRGDKDGVC